MQILKQFKIVCDKIPEAKTPTLAYLDLDRPREAANTGRHKDVAR
jgi:hypothetical protein